MSSDPEIERATPRGPVSRPEIAIPVVARLQWAGGDMTQTPAAAVAWTRGEVQIQWRVPGERDVRQDWVSASVIRDQWEDLNDAVGLTEHRSDPSVIRS
jgi:hypothetical protein